MDDKKLDELIDWCRKKIANKKADWRSGEKIDFCYICGYEDAMKAVMSKLHNEKENPQRELSLTEEEIFALRAVAYGCNTNKRLVCGEFFDMKTHKVMSFKDALVRVGELLEKAKGESTKAVKSEIPTTEENDLANKLQKELDAAKQCIYKIEDALNRGSDNDYARQAIEEWEGNI